MAHDQPARKTRDSGAERSRQPQERGADAIHDDQRQGIATLQSVAGNRAVAQLLASRAARAVAGTAATQLEPDVRAEMEVKFGCDFASVRVHKDAAAAHAAQDVHARAYTLGDDIVFARGAYAPHATQGRQLLAHELAHVVQQRRGGSPPLPVDAALEAGADRAAAAVSGSGPVGVAGASAPGVAMQAAEGWYEYVVRKMAEWRDWAVAPAAPKPQSKAWIDDLYQPKPALPAGATPRNEGAYHEVPNDPNPVPEHTPDEADEQIRRRQPESPGRNVAVDPPRAGDAADTPARRATSQAQRTPQVVAPPPLPDIGDPDATQIMTAEQRKLLAHNSAVANQDWPEAAEPQRRWVRRGRSLRRGSATVGGMLFTVVAAGGSLYFLSQAEDPEQLIDRAGDLAVEAVAGAAIFRLFGPAGMFLGVEGANPQIARNRDTMEFIHANFGHYFESDRVTGEETYTGPGDFMTLFQEADDLLHNTDAIELPAPEPTHGYPDKGSMAPVRLR